LQCVQKKVIIFLTFALQPHVENTRFLLNIELIKLLPVSRSYQVVVSQFDGLLIAFSSPVAVVDLMSMYTSVAQQFVFNDLTAT
jgi:saccharopine dehydrogenase-like NADP-dependent oxidoreductase